MLEFFFLLLRRDRERETENEKIVRVLKTQKWPIYAMREKYKDFDMYIVIFPSFSCFVFIVKQSNAT